MTSGNDTVSHVFFSILVEIPKSERQIPSKIMEFLTLCTTTHDVPLSGGFLEILYTNLTGSDGRVNS